MVLREVDEAAPDPNANYSSSDPSTPASTDAFNDADTPKIDLPDGRSLPVWTVPSVKRLIGAHPKYPNPFTPIPIYAKLLGWTESVRDVAVLTQVNCTQLYIARPLEPIEVEAETYYGSILYKYMYKSEAMGVASFLALAALRSNGARTRPGLITPYAKKYMGDFVGGWYITITRYGFYGLVGRLQGQLIGALLGGNRMKQFAENDPNIKDLRRDLSEFRQWNEAEILRKIQRRKEGSKESIFPTMEELMKHSMEHRRHQVGGGEKREEAPLEESVVDHSKRDTENMSKWPYKRPYPPPGELPSSLGDALQDIIPPSSSEYIDPSPPGRTNPGESTWDRIRRERMQAENNNNPDLASESGSGSKSDSFTFSDRDRERQLAQAGAQRDFDARLERERNGQRGWGS